MKNISLHIRTFAACAAAFLALDAIWLTTSASLLYRPAIGHLMRPDVDWLAAALFYVVYVTGLVVFAIKPASAVRDAAIRGAGFGFVAYATYDLTCQATMLDWPWHVTLIDLAWGSFASAAACAAAWWLTYRPSRR